MAREPQTGCGISTWQLFAVAKEAATAFSDLSMSVEIVLSK